MASRNDGICDCDDADIYNLSHIYEGFAPIVVSAIKGFIQHHPVPRYKAHHRTTSLPLAVLGHCQTMQALLLCLVNHLIQGIKPKRLFLLPKRIKNTYHNAINGKFFAYQW